MSAKPAPLGKGDKDNFRTIMKASDNRDLALVATVRKSDQKEVALVCAMNTLPDGSIMPVPLAVMIEGNPYELFEDPLNL